MEKYTISTTYHLHSGGTKFYETVKISDIPGGQHMLIKRYGSVDKRHGGGQVKIEKYDGRMSACSAELSEIIASKQKGNKDGHYIAASLGWGLHSAGSKTYEGNEFERAIRSHYSFEHASAIVSHFASPTSVTNVETVDDDIVDTSVMEPEPDRGEQWGSW